MEKVSIKNEGEMKSKTFNFNKITFKNNYLIYLNILYLN